MKLVLQVCGLEKSFKKSLFSKKKTILHNLSFSLLKGEVTGFLGPNGSGKTTALKCILGLIPYDKGEIKFFPAESAGTQGNPCSAVQEDVQGKDVQGGKDFVESAGTQGNPCSAVQEDVQGKDLQLTNRFLWSGRAKSVLLPRAILKRVGFLPEEPCFYNYLTAEELLMLYGRLSSNLKTADLKVRVRKWLKKLGIEGAKDQKIKTFSKGMLRKVGLAQALMFDPELLILDEPLAGLDPDSREQVCHIIKDHAKILGGAVFFSSHLLYDMQKICDKQVVLSANNSHIVKG